MSSETLSARLVEIEAMLDRSRRRFEEGGRLVEEAHRSLAEVQQLLIGSPVTLSPEDNEEAASRLLASLKANGGELPETLCGGRLAVDEGGRILRVSLGDGHAGGAGDCRLRRAVRAGPEADQALVARFRVRRGFTFAGHELGAGDVLVPDVVAAHRLDVYV